MKQLKGKSTILIFVLIFIILAGTGIVTVKNTYDTAERTEDLAIELKTTTEAIEELAEGIEELAIENRELAEQNRDHIRCIANLFAKFTRDRQPIIVEDLNKCKVKTPTEERASSQQTRNQEATPPTQTREQTQARKKQPSRGSGNSNDSNGSSEPSLLDRAIEQINGVVEGVWQNLQR